MKTATLLTPPVNTWEELHFQIHYKGPNDLKVKVNVSTLYWNKNGARQHTGSQSKRSQSKRNPMVKSRWARPQTSKIMHKPSKKDLGLRRHWVCGPINRRSINSQKKVIKMVSWWENIRCIQSLFSSGKIDNRITIDSRYLELAYL